MLNRTYERNKRNQERHERERREAALMVLGESSEARKALLYGEWETTDNTPGIEPTPAQLRSLLNLMRERLKQARQLYTRLKAEGISEFSLGKLKFGITEVERLIVNTECALLLKENAKREVRDER